MGIGPLKNSSDSNQIPVDNVPSTSRDDEISLADLWSLIAKRKWIILLNVLVSLILATAYVVVTKPIYTVEINLLPPLERDIQPLLLHEPGYNKFHTTDSVYKEYLNNLNSRGLRREFFEAHNLKEYYLSGKTNTESNIDEIFDGVFNKNLRIQADTPSSGYATASFSYTDAKLTAEWLNQFVLFVDGRTIQQLSDGINAILEAKILQLQYKIKIKLTSAEHKKWDRITALQEAIRIAKLLNIEADGALSSGSDKVKTRISRNTVQTPLYYRGSKALETEVSILKSRKSEKPFILRLRDLQENISYLEGLAIETDGLSAVTVDSPARVPYRAAWPRTKLILILGALLGMTAGLLMILIIELRQKAHTNL